MRPEPVPFSLATATAGRDTALPWLVLGKGPSAAGYSSDLARNHHAFALNHAVRGSGALVGHAIDVEVFEQLRPADLDGVEWLCLPWIPHVRQRRPLYGGKSFFGPGRMSVVDHAAHVPIIASYLQRGRLMSYDFGSAPPALRHGGLPRVEGPYTFSAAVAIQLLAQSGAAEIRTLGIDGGSRYSPAFSDLAATTLLQTRQTGFDTQFQEMADTLNQFGDLVAGPLDASLPARVFVGCMPEQDLAFQVLKYSIHRHASLSVRVERLHDAIARSSVAVPEPLDPANRGRTPFSFQRFAIPAVCGYQGRAVYVDSDMLVLRDMRRLWTFDMQSQQMLAARQPAGSGRAPQFSVMLIDCERLRWDAAALVARLDTGEFSYAQLVHEMRAVDSWRDALPEAWNSLEHYDPAETCLLHFTDMDGQPWLNPLHPHGALWAGYLLDAVRDGAIAQATIENEVAAGHVRPSLLEQMACGERDARRLPLSVLRKDLVEFSPPHRRGNARLSRWHHEAYRARALARHALDEGLVRPTVRRTRRLASALIAAITPR